MSNASVTTVAIVSLLASTWEAKLASEGLSPIDSGKAVRRQVIEQQSLSEQTQQNLRQLERKYPRVAPMLAEGAAVVDIARRQHLKYDHVWQRCRRVMREARAAPPVDTNDEPNGHQAQILELFAEVQGLAPEHAKAHGHKVTNET